MDTVIRSAQLAPLRTRLSETRRDQLAIPSADAAVHALREKIETEVRSELEVYAQKLYDSECKRAYAEGYAVAVADANGAAEKELAQSRTDLEAKMATAFAALEKAHQAALSKLESSVGEVAFAAVCQLAGLRATSRAFVLGIVEQTCAHVRADAIATVRLNPRDIGILSDRLKNNELLIGSLGLKVIADASIKFGGCVIEAASGQYDGGLESQLRRLYAALTGVTATQDQSVDAVAVEHMSVAEG